MAQLVEQRPYKAKVGSSSLSGSTVTPHGGMPRRGVGQSGGMSPRTATLSLMSVLAVASLSACSPETPPAVSGPSSDASVAGPDPVPSTTVVTDPAAVLEVEDQTSEGPTVLVSAAATKGALIVILSGDGRSVIGTGIVDAGTEAKKTQVSLADQPTDEIELIARLYADTDRNGLYGAADQPLTNGKDDDSDDAEVFAGEQASFTFQGKKVQD